MDYGPFSMDYGRFSIITNHYVNENNENVTVYKYNKNLLHVSHNSELNENNVIMYDLNNNYLDCFVDSAFDGYFIRNISNIFLKIANNKILYEESPINVKFNSAKEISRKDYVLNDSILTFDLETFSNDCVPYACGFFDGDKPVTFYLTDFNSIEDMIKACFNQMITPKYDKYTIYVHNLARFDGKILFKILVEFFDIKPIASNKTAVFSYEVKFVDENCNKISLTIKDSLRILPSSLRKLGKSFNVELLKGVFPYKFVNGYNLNYIGVKPPIDSFNLYDLVEISYDELKHNFVNNKIMFDFDLINSQLILPYDLNKYYEFNEKDFPPIDFFNEYKLAILEYNKIKIDSWNLKNETIHYLSGDLISLHQIIIKYIKEIHKDYKLNVTNYVKHGGKKGKPIAHL